jgi:hypothetical protein
MANAINVQPKILNLELYAGDGISFRLMCTSGVGAPVDITGTVSAQIRLVPTAIDPPIVDFTVGLTDAYLGIIILSLTGEQTQELSEHPSSVAGRFMGVWDVEWEPVDSEPRTLCQGKVECVSDVTR